MKPRPDHPAVVAILLLMGGSVPGLAAQASMSAEERAFSAEVSVYRLVMPELRSWYATQTDMALMQREHEEEEFADPHAGLAAFQQALEAHPDFHEILDANGLTAHKFTILTGAWSRAMLAYTRVQRGAPAEATAGEAGTPLENVELLRNNAGEVAALQKRLEAALLPD